jgi:hypothetical protein
MKKLSAYLFLLLFTLQIPSWADNHCNQRMPSNSKETILKHSPAWFLNPPPDTEEITYGVGYAASAQPLFAHDKSFFQARQNITCKKFSVCTTVTNESDGSATTVCKVKEATLDKIIIVKTHIEEDSQIYYVYTLVKTATAEPN